MECGEECEWDEFAKMPLRCLGPSSRSNLSLLLNPLQLLTCDSGHARDFRGVAELMSFSYNQIENFKRLPDPFAALVESFSSLPAGREAKVKDLLLMLQTIGRFDVIDDVLPSLTGDLFAFQDRKPVGPIEETETATQDGDESQILSLFDLFTGEKAMFDAYVCYADADLDFVRQLNCKLEEQGIKLFIRERDLPAGALQYDVFTQLIEKRCRRVLVILSPDFLECSECDLQTRFAASLGANQRNRKLIPVVYRACGSLPASLNMLTKIDFSRGVHEWSWQKLVVSIKSRGNGFVTERAPTVKAGSPPDACLPDARLPESLPPIPDSCHPVTASEDVTKSVMISNPQAACKEPRSWFKSVTNRFKSKSSSDSAPGLDSRRHLIQKDGLSD